MWHVSKLIRSKKVDKVLWILTCTLIHAVGWRLIINVPFPHAAWRKTVSMHSFISTKPHSNFWPFSAASLMSRACMTWHFLVKFGGSTGPQYKWIYTQNPISANKLNSTLVSAATFVWSWTCHGKLWGCALRQWEVVMASRHSVVNKRLRKF